MTPEYFTQRKTIIDLNCPVAVTVRHWDRLRSVFSFSLLGCTMIIERHETWFLDSKTSPVTLSIELMYLDWSNKLMSAGNASVGLELSLWYVQLADR